MLTVLLPIGLEDLLAVHDDGIVQAAAISGGSAP